MRAPTRPDNSKALKLMFEGTDSHTDATIKRLQEKAKEQGMSDNSLRMFINKCIAFTLIESNDCEKALEKGYSLFYKKLTAFGVGRGDGYNEILTLNRILNAYPNETVTILSDLIDRNLYRKPSPLQSVAEVSQEVAGLSESLQCLQGAMIIIKSGHSETHKKLWFQWHRHWDNTPLAGDAAEDIWSIAESSDLNPLIAIAFWAKHVDPQIDLKNIYTQVTGLTAPDV